MEALGFFLFLIGAYVAPKDEHEVVLMLTRRN